MAQRLGLPQGCAVPSQRNDRSPRRAHLPRAAVHDLGVPEGCGAARAPSDPKQPDAPDVCPQRVVVVVCVQYPHGAAHPCPCGGGQLCIPQGPLESVHVPPRLKRRSRERPPGVRPLHGRHAAQRVVRYYFPRCRDAVLEWPRGRLAHPAVRGPREAERRPNHCAQRPRRAELPEPVRHHPQRRPDEAHHARDARAHPGGLHALQRDVLVGVKSALVPPREHHPQGEHAVRRSELQLPCVAGPDAVSCVAQRSADGVRRLGDVVRLGLALDCEFGDTVAHGSVRGSALDATHLRNVSVLGHGIPPHDDNTYFHKSYFICSTSLKNNIISSAYF
eukprot:PhM_4_TR7919/c0_g1_i1/m.102242